MIAALSPSPPSPLAAANEAANEAARLETLSQYSILDTPPEKAFDDLARSAASCCDTPVALISFIDSTRMWIKSRVGADVKEIPREASLCTHTILQPDVMIVPDALADTRFAANPLVITNPKIRFYAGAPLVTSEGHAIGTLSVVDYVPRQVDDEQQEMLRLLAQQVVTQLALRQLESRRASSTRVRHHSPEKRAGVYKAYVEETGLHNRRATDRDKPQRAMDELPGSEKGFRMMFERAAAGMALLGLSGRIIASNLSLQTMLGCSGEELRQMVFTEFTHRDDASVDRDLYTELIDGKRDCYRLEKRCIRQDGTLMWGSATVSIVRNSHGEPQFAVYMVEDTTERKVVEKALRESEEQCGLLFAGNPHPMWIYDLESLAFLAVNEAAVHRYGYSQEEFLQMTIKDIRPSEDIAELLDNVAEDTAAATGFSEACTWQHRNKDGRIIYAEVTAHPLVFAGRRARLVLAQDTTKRKQAEEALHQTQELFQVFMNNSPAVAFMKDEEGRYVYINGMYERAFKIAHADLYGKTDFDWMPEDLAKEVSENDKAVLSTGQTTELLETVPTPDGNSYHWLVFKFPFKNKQGQRFVGGVAVDITARQQAEEALRREAYHDTLTSLPNRALFINHLKRAIARTKRHSDYMFAVLFIDLDRFKIINDSLGHVVADQLLISIARKLEVWLRPEDVVARLGGDEFTILLDDIKDISDATHVADRIQKELAAAFNFNGHEVSITASIGIVLSLHGYDHPEEYLRDADTAMYRAKALGKARHQIFDKTMHAHVTALMKMESNLRGAIERQEFHLHYQPIVLLKTGRVAGFEALVRWPDEKRGLIYPTEFIPVAEETGLIIPLGWWVLREACSQMRAWQNQFSADPPLTISVNLCSRQFLQTDLVEQIEGVLHQTGLDANSLELEITESTIMQDVESATTMLKRLRALGVKLHIDDFGTGYSSLSCLHRFPVDTLKIDRSFVGRMSLDDENTEIVRTIIQLAHNLGIEVVAEGVETADQLAQLKALRCKYGQGYLFSKALNSEAAQAFITV